MRVGPYELTTHNHGFFRLDGGAMFGSVPKTLWAKDAPPDEANRILLATRSLIIQHGNRKMIVDLGCGDKWNEKTRAIFAIPDEAYQPVQGVTHVLLTHLHFDHCGGISKYNESSVEPNYPEAQHYVSQVNLQNAQDPNVRERASYLVENHGILESVNFDVTEDGQEIWPGITVHQADGHTHGLTWVKVTDGETTVVYPADLIPTSKHLPIAYVMGYDICAEQSMKEKRSFLQQVVSQDWVIVYEHDPEVAAGKVQLDERGRPVHVPFEDLS